MQAEIILDQPSKPWRWHFQGNKEALAIFNVGEIMYTLNLQGSNGEWEIEFGRSGSNLTHSEKFGLIGSGSSVQVLSIVINILISFLDHYKDQAKILVFYAEETHHGIYTRLTQRWFPEWKLKKNDNWFKLISPHSPEYYIQDAT
jgi:hypothetical protein